MPDAPNAWPLRRSATGSPRPPLAWEYRRPPLAGRYFWQRGPDHPVELVNLVREGDPGAGRWGWQSVEGALMIWRDSDGVVGRWAGPVEPPPEEAWPEPKTAAEEEAEAVARRLESERHAANMRILKRPGGPLAGYNTP